MRVKNVLFLLFLVAILLRFYQLGTNPPSLSWDEAALGYNAYSIGKTGRDEFGRLLPYDYFASFGDYKPVLYVYAAVFPVKIFGLNEFSVRFPSAFFGVLTVLLTYFLVKELFKTESLKSPKCPNPSNILPLLAAFLLAISPWHVNLSRAGFEANLAVFFVILGIWLFLKGGQFVLLSALAFSASFYTFNSCRAFVPLLLLVFLIFFKDKLLKEKKWLILAAFLGIILILPLVPHLKSPEGRLRFQEVNIFSDLQPIEVANQRIALHQNAWWARIIHNRRVLLAFSFLKHYFDHFHPSFLFLYGDGNPKFSIQDVGQLYLWSLSFLLIGIFSMLKQHQKISLFLLAWMLIAPLPAATARETPHALRIENILPTFQIFIAFGLISFWQWLKNKKKLSRYLLSSVVAFLLFLNIVYYLHNLFLHYPWEFSGEWQYGYKEAINYIKQVEAKYEKVIFTTSLGRPYIYFLFYQQSSPQQFWQNSLVEKEALGFINVRRFGKYEFRSTVTGFDSDSKNLYIFTPKEVPASAHQLKVFKLLNGLPVLVAFEKN